MALPIFVVVYEDYFDPQCGDDENFHCEVIDTRKPVMRFERSPKSYREILLKYAEVLQQPMVTPASLCQLLKPSNRNIANSIIS